MPSMRGVMKPAARTRDWLAQLLCSAIGHITSSLQEHQADIRPNDDQTLIVMRVEENCGSGVA